MPRFFIACSACAGDVISLNGDDARHISSSLRMKIGEALILCGDNGDEYICTVTKVDKNSVSLHVNEVLPCISEPSVKVNLFAALSKGDKFEQVLQKSVELGVFSVTPFLSERCVCRLDEKSFAAKKARYQKIMLEAAKQCGRGIIPQILPLVKFSDAVTLAACNDLPLFLYENETNLSLKSALSEREFTSVSIVSGPEGGFSHSEALTALDAGLLSVSLGKRILRCETAPIAALSAVMYHSGNL